MKTLSEAAQLRLQMFYNREITTESEMMSSVYERIENLTTTALQSMENPYTAPYTKNHQNQQTSVSDCF